MDLSTWVSAAKLKIPSGLNFLNTAINFLFSFMSIFLTVPFSMTSFVTQGQANHPLAQDFMIRVADFDHREGTLILNNSDIKPEDPLIHGQALYRKKKLKIFVLYLTKIL